jgi:hypothetical protein
LEKDKIGLKSKSDPDPDPVDAREAITPRGKPNMVASAIVLERITRHTGSPSSRAHAAASTSGKLYSMNTRPASKLLKSFTWKDYFSSGAFYKDGVLLEFGNLPASAQVTEEADESAAPANLSYEIKHRQFQEHLTVMFNDMVLRAEKLWSQLRFSKFEQKFFKLTLCKGPPQSLQHCQELATYISLLQVHLQVTLKVLECIKIREVAVAKCYDIIAALQRRKLSRSQYPDNGTVAASSSAHRNESTAVGEQQPSSFWKDELLHALDEVRCASLEVIKCIQLWRRNLWRPMPFVWNGDNYLSKMRFDMNILETSSNMEIVSMLGLTEKDLWCIIFFDSQPKPEREQDEIEIKPRMNKGERNPEVIENQQALSQPEENAYIERLTREFKNNIDQHELYTAASIVVEEEKLQNALAVEQASLLEKGVFIPSLRQVIVS